MLIPGVLSTDINFLVVAPGCPGENAVMLAERIRNCVGGETVDIGDQMLRQDVPASPEAYERLILDVLLGDVDIEVERELQCDHRTAGRTTGRHLVQAGHLPELPLERRGHRGGAAPERQRPPRRWRRR